MTNSTLTIDRRLSVNVLLLFLLLPEFGVALL